MAEADAALQVVLEAKIDRLTEKLTAANRAVYGASAKMQKDLDAANRKFENMFSNAGAGGKRLADQFKNVTPDVGELDRGAVAMNALGKAGLFAGAAAVALGAAVAGARGAFEFAAEIGSTAKTLHVTTDALQEYRFAVREAGGETKGADQAIEAFSVNLGKAQQGLVKSRQAFLALGFTKDQIEGFKSVDDALRQVTERIAGLGKTQQKDAIIQQLGLDGLKPLIAEGVDEMDRLRAAAHEAGVVMDASLIARAGKVNDQFEALSDVVNVQLKSALVDLGPVLVGLLVTLGKMAQVAAQVADAFRSIENKTDDGLETKRLQLTKEVMIMERNRALGQPVNEQVIAAKKAAANDIAGIQAERKGSRTPSIPSGGTNLLPPPKSGGRKGPTAEERAARGEQAVEAATRDELRARMALTDNVEEIARLKSQEIDAEVRQKNSRLRADIAAGKIDAAEAEIAIALNERAGDLRRELAARDASDQADEAFFARQREIASDYDRIAAITAGMADTVAESYAIERRALLLRQKRERDDLRADLDKQVERGRITGSARDARIATFEDRADAELRDLTDNAVQNLKGGILDAFEAMRTGGPAGVMEFLAERFKAKLLDNLAERLADIFLSVKTSGGGSGGGILGTIASIFKAIPGFASGTDSAPGGLAYVHRDELINLPKGSQVIPSHALRAIGSMGVPQSRSITMVQPVTFDLRGAVMTDDLLSQMNSISARNSVMAVQASRAAVRDDFGRRGRRMIP